MNNTNNDIDDLLNELKDTKKLGGMIMVESPLPTVQPDINDETINDFIMKKASLLIQQGVDTLEGIKNAVKGSGNPEEVESYSKLITAVTSTVDTLNKINIQNKKAAASRELKKLDMEMKQGQLTNNGNINVLVAPREEIMNKLFNDALEVDIDATYEDVEDHISD